jgi:hypothetical protein
MLTVIRSALPSPFRSLARTDGAAAGPGIPGRLEGAVAVAKEHADGTATAVGHAQVEPTVVVEITDYDDARVQADGELMTGLKLSRQRSSIASRHSRAVSGRRRINCHARVGVWDLKKACIDMRRSWASGVETKS